MRQQVVDLSELGSERLELEASFPPGTIEFSGDAVMQLDTLHWTGFVEKKGPEVRLSGALTSKLKLTCDRCLEPIGEFVRREFDLFFEERDSLVYEENAEIELDETTTQTAFLTGSDLPLGEIMREQVLLALPMKPLCDTQCKGLCPSCGQNLNIDSCGCSPRAMHPAFEVLEKLKDRMDQNGS